MQISWWPFGKRGEKLDAETSLPAARENKPIIGLIAHPLESSASKRPFKGQFLIAYYPHEDHRVEILGRLLPHEEEVELFLEESERARQSGLVSRREPLTGTASGMRAHELDLLKRALAAGDITLDEFQKERASIVSGDYAAREYTSTGLESQEIDRRTEKVTEAMQRLQRTHRGKIVGTKRKQIDADVESIRKIVELIEQHGLQPNNRLLEVEGTFVEEPNEAWKQKASKIFLRRIKMSPISRGLPLVMNVLNK